MIQTVGGRRARKNDPPGFGKWTFWKKGGVKIDRYRIIVVSENMVYRIFFVTLTMRLR